MSDAHRPRKRFGQHFLHDPNTIRRIVECINARACEHLVEIGPGPGVLTRHLAKTAGQLTAIEVDRDLVADLRSEFSDSDSVRIISADALKFDFKQFESPIRVIGNLPYNISTPLLFQLNAARSKIVDACLMLQKEVVLRMAAAPGSKIYGRLSVMLQYAWDIQHEFDVAPGAFSPPPKVNSAIVTMRPRRPGIEVENFASFETLVRTAFSQRRKTIRNSLSKLLSADAISACGISPSARPETLSVDEFVNLSLQKRIEKA